MESANGPPTNVVRHAALGDAGIQTLLCIFPAAPCPGEGATVVGKLLRFQQKDAAQRC